jgi:hypothetical protein
VLAKVAARAFCTLTESEDSLGSSGVIHLPIGR